MKTEQPVYVQWIDRHFGAIMDVLQRVAAHLGNTTLEIVSRAIPLIVPVPNALGVYSAAIHALQWSEATALALALSVECIFFVMFEITLKLWDGYQEDAQYKAPLTAMCIVSGVCVVLVMWLVYSVESMAGGATVLAALPVLSACTSVGIGLLRWHHARTQRIVQKAAQRTKRTAQPEPEIVQPVVQIIETDAQPDKRQRAHNLHSEGLSNAQIAKELDVHRNTVSAWLRTNGASA